MNESNVRLGIGVALALAIAGLGVSIFSLTRETQGVPATQAPAVTEKGTAPEQSLFAPPTDIKALIDRVQESTVIVECGEWLGSGWVIDLPPLDPQDADAEDLELDRQFPYEVITNHHVIEDCTEDREAVTIRRNGAVYEGYLYVWDEDNDLAMVATAQPLPALIESTKPLPGWWAMALGAPDGLEGSVSFGNIMNTDGSDVISTAPLNRGNSGGPLVNSRGEVIGTNSWIAVSSKKQPWQDWNVAVGVPKLCDTLLLCTDDSLTWDR